MRTNSTIKVLIVDDSAVVRSVLSHLLSEAKSIVVVGGAKDPYEARELIIKYRPDVIILDIEMPRMDGLTFLKKLQEHYPVPVIMCSGAAPSNSQAALKSIELGAVDFVCKPSGGGSKALRRLSIDLAEKIRAAVMARPVRPFIPISKPLSPKSFRSMGLDPQRYIVAIGASTGGTEAIKELLSKVPTDFPPVVIVQHMPAGFTKSFAERLNQFSLMTVTEAVDGDQLVTGQAFLSRGEIQMRVKRTGNQWRIVYGSDEPVNRHCPSVDVLFDSIAQQGCKRSIGIILTGMGGDGAKGLLHMKEQGAVTIAQDHDSCVVYGMPKVAVELGAVQYVVSPGDIPSKVIGVLQQQSQLSGRTICKIDSVSK